MSLKQSHDGEGKIRMAIFTKDRHLVIDFGKKISWIGLHKDEVENLIIALHDNLKRL